MTTPEQFAREAAQRPRRLESAIAATAYQKQWFAELRERVAGGEPFALVNADAPQEILRAMDIPYVVNQWWASIVAAKRLGPQSLAALRERGYPDYVRQYDALPLGAFDFAAEDAPWGGLPKPDIVIAETSGDSARKVFDLWAEREGIEFFPYERTGADPAPAKWWELVPHRWEEAFGSARIDLMAAENQLLVEKLEGLTGRRFEIDRLAEVMRRTNEQAEWNRDTRDRIAAARPTPISVNDSMPSVMVPQWHRGTQWAVDAAKALNTEVRQRIDIGAAVCPKEKLRLMWVGRGLWTDMSLYQEFQDRHGAVFVWSMYLAIAADGYARYGDDPIRALAARFVGLTDQLYAPPWSNDWYVKEARAHGVHGVVHLVADDVPGSHFTTEALENAGIPVLEIHASNADSRSTDSTRLRADIGAFLENRVRNEAD